MNIQVEALSRSANGVDAAYNSSSGGSLISVLLISLAVQATERLYHADGVNYVGEWMELDGFRYALAQRQILRHLLKGTENQLIVATNTDLFVSPLAIRIHGLLITGAGDSCRRGYNWNTPQVDDYRDIG